MDKVPHVIHEAVTDEEIKSLFPVYRELHPHVHSPEELFRVAKIIKEETPTHFLCVKDTIDGESQPRVVSILTYRIQHCLFYYKKMQIFDFHTLPTVKEMGYGEALMDKAKEIANQEQCNATVSDSGYTQNDAHRVYFNKGFYTRGHHFTLNLDPVDKRK